jgi:FkbM family methyltransferase
MLIGTMEPELIEQFQKNLVSGNTFLDLGANEGLFSVIASRIVGPTGRVVAIEPQSRLGPVILKNLALNRCMNCVLVQCVVTDHNGEATLNLSPSNNTGSTSVFRVQKYPVKHETVPSFTLETLLASLGIPYFDFVKVDVEGSEYNLFMSARDVLERGVFRKIALEVHCKVLARWGFSETDLHQRFLDCGYVVDMEYPREAEKLIIYSHKGLPESPGISPVRAKTSLTPA